MSYQVNMKLLEGKNMTEENTIQEFRLRKIDETRNYNWRNESIWFNE